jgi:hypothetical protein
MKYTVTYSISGLHTVEVEAKCEKEACEKADKELEKANFGELDVDDFPIISIKTEDGDIEEYFYL